MRIRNLLAVLPVTAVLALAACGHDAKTGTPGSGGGASNGAGNSNGAGSSGGGGNHADGYEGSLATSGLYQANWSASQATDLEPFNAYGAVTLTSDKQTYGNVSVSKEGAISFGSGDPAFKSLSYRGTGAQVVLDKSGQFVCSFTVDADLAGEAGETIHLAGSMTLHWHPEGIGDISCP